MFTRPSIKQSLPQDLSTKVTVPLTRSALEILSSRHSRAIDASSRAPAPPQIDDSSSSLVDIDSQHIKEKTSEEASQVSENVSRAADKTSQKSSEASSAAKEKAAEARDYTSQKSSEIADAASTDYNKAKAAAKKNAKKAKKEIDDEYNDVYTNRDNPVIIANGVVIALAAVGLAYGGYRKHQVGELDWKLAGTAAAIVGILGVGDYYLSQWVAGIPI
ncbi:MAG: hypothetical protein Q9163_005126 [Psora crenata]